MKFVLFALIGVLLLAGCIDKDASETSITVHDCDPTIHYGDLDLNFYWEGSSSYGACNEILEASKQGVAACSKFDNLTDFEQVTCYPKVNHYDPVPSDNKTDCACIYRLIRKVRDGIIVLNESSFRIIRSGIS